MRRRLGNAVTIISIITLAAIGVFGTYADGNATLLRVFSACLITFAAIWACAYSIWLLSE